MRLDPDKVKTFVSSKGVTLSAALERSGVSRTAYYSLCRRPSVLPRSVRALAAELQVQPDQLLTSTRGPDFYQEQLQRAQEICERYPDVDFSDVWHTLTLLELPPVERLNRSLRRGRA